MMTYSKDDEKSTAYPVRSTVPVPFNPATGNDASIDSTSCKSMFTNSATDLPQTLDLCAIDMTSANKQEDNIKDEQARNDNSLLRSFQRLSVNNSSTINTHVCQESSACDIGLGFSCETETARAAAMNWESRTMPETASHLFLFVGDGDGDTALHVCIMRGDEERSIHIINRAPDFTYLNIQNNFLQTPVHLAANTNASKIVRKLICSGADIQCQDKDANTALHIACAYGHIETVKQLLRPVTYEETVENNYPIPFMAIPQNLNLKNCEGLTCLHLAVLRQDVEAMRLLLEAGADPNVGDSKSGKTALHLAAEQGLLDCVFLLTRYRMTEIDALNYAGHTPALLAYSRGHLNVTGLLARYGASYVFDYETHQDQDAASADDSNSDMENDTF